jgi:hypothetical protein
MQKNRIGIPRLDASLVERDADPLFASPNRVARAHELIGCYHKGKVMRHPDAICDFNARAIRGDISYGAIDAAALVERECAAFEHSMPRYRSLLDHRRRSEFQSMSVENSRVELPAIESNVP